MNPVDPDHYDEDPDEEHAPEEVPAPAVSFRTAMLVYAGLIVFCLATLHGTALFIAVLIVCAIALKTWVARARDRLN
jgi:predicted metal-dependent hydrolase